MTIQCRTGCGQKITYESYEFSDGFLYFLPRNEDSSIHNCSNLPKSFFEEDWPDVGYQKELVDLMSFVAKDYQNEQMEADTSGPEEPPNLENFEPSDLLLKKDLLNAQMLCILLPSPFLIAELDFLDDEAPKGEYSTDLIELADAYKDLGDFSNACRALDIQNLITHDQSQKIFELRKQMEDKQNTKNVFFESENLLEIHISVIDLRNEYIRKCERFLKSFIRKKYPLDKLKKEFPDAYKEAEKRRGEGSKLGIEKEVDDIIENLPLGFLTNIIKIKKRKKQWDEFDYDNLNFLYTITNVRNDIDHFSGPNLEKSMPKDNIALCYIYCKKIIQLLEDLEIR